MIRTSRKGLGICFVALFAISFASSQAAARTPTETVQKAINDLRDIFKNEALSSEQRQGLIQEVLLKNLDTDELARLILTKYRGKDKEALLPEFQIVYRKFLTVSMSRLVAVLFPKFEFNIFDEKVAGDNASVSVHILWSERNEIFHLAFQLRLNGESWRIYDVYFGTDLTKAEFKTYSSEEYKGSFYRVLKNRGLGELILKLKERSEQNRDKK